MSRNSKNIKMLISDELQRRLNAGMNTSRHDDKLKNDGAASAKIYSFTTFKTYKAALFRFAEWLDTLPEWKTMPKSKRTLSAARPYCDKYILNMIERKLSPYTCKMMVSAFAKLYGETCESFPKTPPSSRAELTRSRCRVKYDRHFSEKNNAELIEFCRSTGLRRNELEHCRGSFLVEKDGKLFLDFTGQRSNFCKGGRPRMVPVCGDVELVRRLCSAAGENLVFPVVHHAADIHHYRSEYCRRVYDAAAASVSVSERPRSELYVCRGDMAGLVLWRPAMAVASAALGHSRIDVIASNYFYKSDD